MKESTFKPDKSRESKSRESSKKISNSPSNNTTNNNAINKLQKRLTLAQEDKSPTLKNKTDSPNNRSVNSYYSSLGSVNIENYYLHKKEKAFLELQKGLNEKNWDEDVIRDIVKLLRSYMEVDISNRNWIRFFLIILWCFYHNFRFFQCFPLFFLMFS